jgi:hypothetical protein
MPLLIVRPDAGLATVRVALEVNIVVLGAAPLPFDPPTAAVH